SSSDEFSFFASEKSQVKSLEILMPHQWFFNQLKMECSDENLNKFLKIRNLKPVMDLKIDIFRNSFHKIIREANKDILNTICFEENVNTILKNFFSKFNSDLKSFLEIDKVKISKEEVSRLIAVKKQLEQPVSFSQPSFSSLTKIALMSSTTLKTKFKKMYGASLFQYFQRIRMEKARVLLLTHKFSVKQIGLLLGYTNMNNFTIAFKKEFNKLPSELI
ncbi:MAG: helix-turn-helix transcriptional regulator, partial [Ginsengibacter sp.]